MKKNFIATYVLDESNNIKNFIKYIEKDLSITKRINLPNAQKNKIINYSVEDWLYVIKNCNFLITDSFHGVCFAIIFNKPFICIMNEGRGEARFKSIIKTFNIDNLFIKKSSIDTFQTQYTDWTKEYDKINDIILSEKYKSIKWLSKAIVSSKEKRNLFDTQTEEIITYLIKKIDIIDFKQKKLKSDILHIQKTPKYILKYVVLFCLNIFTFFKIIKFKSKYNNAKLDLKKSFNLIFK